MPHRRQPWKLLSAFLFAAAPRPYESRANGTQVGNFFPVACKSFLAALLVTALPMSPAPSLAAEREADDLRAARAQQVVDALREQLGISAGVSVVVVERDPRVVSVRSRRDGSGGFALSVERGFAASVSDLQLRAALAHELGHVWIATHHPYLQTEQLANRVAMRVVSREALVDVYRTLWGAEALHGKLETFLGVQAKAEQ